MYNMPFNVVKYKRGWRVMDDKGNFYSKKPLTKTMARRQQKALYASEARREHLSGSGYASYTDDEGNHHILLIGDGFFGDIWTKVKQVGNFISKTLVPVITQPSLQTVSTAIGQTVRLDYPPKARETLARYGSGSVYQLMIVREPIQSFINQALNAITLGRWNEAKRKLNYDSLFHLSMVASLSMPNGDKATIKIEKNEVINITDKFALKQPGVSSGSTSNVSRHGSGRDAEFMPVPVSCCITLTQMMTNAQNAIGEDFFKYDAFYNNCQIFIINILRANDLLTPEVENFINQNAEQLLQELPSYTRPVAGLITNIAGLANRIMYGEGEDEMYGGCMECGGTCMEAVGNRFEGGKLYCGLKETPPGDEEGDTYSCFKKGVGVGMMLEQQKPKPQKPLEEMTLRELGQEASQRKVSKYSTMKKQELIEALRPLRGGGECPCEMEEESDNESVESKEAVRQYALNSLRDRIKGGDRPAPPGLEADGSWSGAFEDWQKSDFPGCGPNSYYSTNGECYENCWEKEMPYACQFSKEEREKNVADIKKYSNLAEVRTAIQDENLAGRYFSIENRKQMEQEAKTITAESGVPPTPKWEDIMKVSDWTQVPQGYTGFVAVGNYNPTETVPTYNILYYRDGKMIVSGLRPGSNYKYTFDWEKAKQRWDRLQQYDPNRPGNFATQREDNTFQKYDSLGREVFDPGYHGSINYLNSVKGRHIREADPYFEELYQRMKEQDHAFNNRSQEEINKKEEEWNRQIQEEEQKRYGENQDIYSPESNFTLTDKKGNRVRVNKVRLRQDGGYDIQFANGSWEYQAGEDEWDCNEWKRGDRIENYGVCGTEGRKKASENVKKSIYRERDAQWDSMSGWDKFVNGLSVAGAFTQDYILPVASTVLQFVPGVGQAISTGLDIAGAVAGKLTEGQCRHFNECSDEMAERGKAEALYHRTKGDSVAERYLTDDNWAKLLEANRKVYGLVGDTAKYGSRAGKFYETGAGKPANEPLSAFKKQLKKEGITPEKYLEIVREIADEEGYDGRAVEFSDDPEKKLMIYDDEGKKRYFGAVGYNDFILWSKREALGKVREGFAEQKRRVFNASHSKMPGDWKKDKFSPNNLSMKILW